MKNKIDINDLGKNNPFTVPEDYFTTLTHNIMERVESPEQVKITAFFQLKTIVPTLAIAVILFSGFWYNKNQEININKPFPFLVNGNFDSLDWHIIDWKEGDLEHSHAKHIQARLNGTKHNTKERVLGFYSNKHHAI